MNNELSCRVTTRFARLTRPTAWLQNIHHSNSSCQTRATRVSVRGSPNGDSIFDNWDVITARRPSRLAPQEYQENSPLKHSPTAQAVGAGSNVIACRRSNVRARGACAPRLCLLCRAIAIVQAQWMGSSAIDCLTMTTSAT